MHSKRVTLLVACLIAFLASAPLAAQTTTGTILGAVTDSSGARIGSAVVSAVNEQTKEKHATSTSAGGDYMFSALPVGEYRVEVETPGFKKYVHQGIVLDVNQNARVDAIMELGQVTQEVLVSGEVPLVDTHEVQLGGIVDSQRMNDLPLNGRNVYSLVT